MHFLDRLALDDPEATTVEKLGEVQTNAAARHGTPYFCFKDLDENKPTGSIRIRVETIDYFLRRYRERKLTQPSTFRRASS